MSHFLEKEKKGLMNIKFSSVVLRTMVLTLFHDSLCLTCACLTGFKYTFSNTTIVLVGFVTLPLSVELSCAWFLRLSHENDAV